MITGLKIKLKRIEKGYKQGDFAKAIGVTPQCLRKLENGITKNPSILVMKKIANALDTSVQELFFND